jgi:predicted site-specific integrase-resolvase
VGILLKASDFIRKIDLTKEFYKPGEVAEILKVSPMTVIRYDNAGDIKFDRTPAGRRVITRDNLIEYLNKCGLIQIDNSRIDVIYARVSTHKQNERGDLARQIEVVSVFASTKNPVNLEVIKEVGSGLNDNRVGLRKLLQRILHGEIGRVFVNYKDRLTRFGFRYIEEICKATGTELIIVSNETQVKTVQEELAEDLCSVIHSFSGKLYGMRKTVGKRIENKVNALYEGGVADED